ncbi:ribonuclease D [Roseiterribacter gracilis]|uniref:Ribonuclease D n=1 Tax=Roseiterribacter gracilis TaxID=2812848 RepID=A0A8S8XDD4_9PROT|nr:ribonuclease D [Rhodospirillales bacterium TMPK1]
MTILTTTAEVEAFCAGLAGADFVAVDTEFLRDSTYWPRLCLIQVAGPDAVAAIDPLAPDISLDAFQAILDDEKILKVFHAGRQDLEIFFHRVGRLPSPIFDTQVAGMVTGFGESASYETLVNKLAGAQLDKHSRFTDWAQRPLTDRQLAYALDDVIHLRTIYTRLSKKLAKSGREAWLQDEMRILTDPNTFRLEPEDAWKRLKLRTEKPRLLAVLKELAAWRETEAQKRDLPRNRVIKDETLLEIATQMPTDAHKLARTRGLSSGFAEGKWGEAILAAINRGLAVPAEDCPKPGPRIDLPPGLGPTVELLKVLLRYKADEHDVAPKLLANSSDLERLAADDDAPIPALSGWRKELFGDDALKLKHGQLALGIEKKRIKLVPAPE